MPAGKNRVFETSVIIIGCGIIGAAIAEAIARRGIKVRVVDVQAAGSATQASAGILGPYLDVLTDSPLVSLCERSLDLFDDWVRLLADRSGFQINCVRSGSIELSLDRAGNARLQARKEWLEKRRIPYESLNAVDLRKLEPSISPEATEGILLHQQGYVNACTLLDALRASARSCGAVIEYSGRVLSVKQQDQSAIVRTERENYRADFVVIAAGAWSAQIDVLGASPLPVRPIRGQLLRLKCNVSGTPNHVLWSLRCYVVPWPDNTLLVGSTMEDVGFNPSSTMRAVRDLSCAVTELVPAAEGAHLEAVHVGLRPAPAGELPLIGPFDGAPRIVVATGHHRNGILLTPLTAEIVMRYIVDSTLDPAISLIPLT